MNGSLKSTLVSRCCCLVFFWFSLDRAAELQTFFQKGNETKQREKPVKMEATQPTEDQTVCVHREAERGMQLLTG